MIPSKSKIVAKREKEANLPHSEEANSEIEELSPHQNGREELIEAVRSESKQKKVRSLPRPVIQAKHYKHVKNHNNATYSDPPAFGRNSICLNELVASSRFVNPTTYAILSDPKTMRNSKIPISFVLQPLNLPGALDEPIPKIEVTSKNFIRCSNCFAFRNSFFKRLSPGSMLCNICLSPFATHGTEILDSDIQGHAGIYDLHIATEDNHFAKPETITRRLFFCFEVSPRTVVEGTLDSIVDYVSYILKSLDYQADIGFIIYDVGVEMVSSLSNEAPFDIFTVKTPDTENAFCPLNIKEFLFGLTEGIEKMEAILEFIKSRGERIKSKLQAQPKARKAHQDSGNCLFDLLHYLEALCKPRGAKVFIFNSNIPRQGKGALNVDDMAIKSAVGSQENDSKANQNPQTLFKCQNKEYMNLGVLLKQSLVSVDLYLFNNQQSEISTIALVPMFTGGKVHHFPKYDSFDNGNELYYSLLNGLSRNSGSAATIRARMNPEFSFRKTSGKFGVSDMNYITLPWVNSEDYFVFHYELEKNRKEKECVYAQFVLMFDDCDKNRFIRVFNIKLMLIDTMSQIYGNLNLNGLFLDLIRSQIDSLRSKTLKQIKANLIANLKGIILEFLKSEFQDKNLKQSELSVPRKIEHILLYFHSFLRDSLMRLSPPFDRDALFMSYLRLLQNPVAIFFYLYPKIFSLHDIDTSSPNCPCVSDDSGELQFVRLPDSLPCTLAALEQSGVYLVDEGSRVHLLVFAEAEPEVLSQLFGTENIDEIHTMHELPSLEDSALNQTARMMLEELRRLKNYFEHEVVICIQGDQLFDKTLERVCVEDARLDYKMTALDFMKQLNDLLIQDASK